MSARPAVEAGEVAWLRAGEAMASSARREAAAQARRAGLGPGRAADLAIAVTEAATNLMRHSVDGAMALWVTASGTRAAVEILALDSGPGIADIGAALRDGSSTAGTLGVGLGAISRLADVFGIHTLPGRGTGVYAGFAGPRARGAEAGAYDGTRDTRGVRVAHEVHGAAERYGASGAPGAPGVTGDGGGSAHEGSAHEGFADGGSAGSGRPDPYTGTEVGLARIGGLTRPISGETQCGDTWAVREGGAAEGAPAIVVMMCDGLGHGPLAARAADEARQAFRESRDDEPAEILAAVHARLRGTRGAAVAVARVDPERRMVRLCGAGNIGAFVLGAASRRMLSSSPGIVGHSISRPHVFEAALPRGEALVMHSDGLSGRWQPGDFPGLLGHAPALIAGQLMWQTGVRRDDAGVVVLQVPS